MQKLTKKKFAHMTYDDLRSLSRPEAQSMLKQAREMYKAQKKIFSRHESTVYSHSYHLMEDYYRYKNIKSPSKTKKVDAVSELERLRKFFASRTSTVKGSRELIKEQSARIFGVDDSGKPLRTMSASQAQDFWALYNEFLLGQKESDVRNWGSNRIQQYIGEMLVERPEFQTGFTRDAVFFTASDFRHLEERLRDEVGKENWENGSFDWESNLFTKKKRSNK